LTRLKLIVTSLALKYLCQGDNIIDSVVENSARIFRPKDFPAYREFSEFIFETHFPVREVEADIKPFLDRQNIAHKSETGLVLFLAGILKLEMTVMHDGTRAGSPHFCTRGVTES